MAFYVLIYRKKKGGEKNKKRILEEWLVKKIGGRPNAMNWMIRFVKKSNTICKAIMERDDDGKNIIVKMSGSQSPIIIRIITCIIIKHNPTDLAPKMYKLQDTPQTFFMLRA